LGKTWKESRACCSRCTSALMSCCCLPRGEQLHGVRARRQGKRAHESELDPSPAYIVLPWGPLVLGI